MKAKKDAASKSSSLCWVDANLQGVVRFRDASDAMDGVLAGARAPLIARRVNQGPAFDAMVKAVAAIVSVREKYGLVDPPEFVALRAAFNLAKEVS